MVFNIPNTEPSGFYPIIIPIGFIIMTDITQYSTEETQDILASVVPADNFTAQQSDEDLADYLETLNIRT
jgi:hypothetical protein